MRIELKKIGSKERYRFEGTVVRFGTASNPFNPYNHIEETILLEDVYLLDEDGQHKEFITDHLWFKRTLQFQRIDARPDDIIQFDARVDSYYKRDREVDFYNKVKDYRLVRPTKIVNISRPDAKVEVLSVKEQHEAQKEQWEKARLEREEQEKVRLASEYQIKYIKLIAEHLKLEDPTTDNMLFVEAKKWLNDIFAKHKNLEAEMKRVKLDKQVEQTKRRNNLIYQTIKSGEKSFEEMAEEYNLKLSTIKRIYKEQDKL